MNQAEISKLVTFIEENLRASPSSGLPFVDSRSSCTRLLAKQNHVVFGRRGSGKTTLVNSTKASPDHLDLYLNLEDYKDITFPNIVIRILIEMFTLLSEQIKANYPWYRLSLKSLRCKRAIKLVCASLRAFLHDPDQETQEVSTSESYQNEASASAKIDSVSAGAKMQHGKSTQVKRNLPKDKINYLRIELTTYKKLIISILIAIFKQADVPYI